MPGTKPLILASASRSRRDVLTNAGLVFTAEPSDCDEDKIKSDMARAGADPSDVAAALAEAKADIVASRYPDALVIGADQMMVYDGKWYDKPADIADARNHLMTLRGKTHSLLSATVVMTGGCVVWSYRDAIDMTMRNFSDLFVDNYLEAVGDDALRSVGAYQLEGRGAQLFDKVGGDFFSILGLPLLPLLAFLRGQGQVPA